MSISSYIKENVRLLGSNVYVSPNIPEKKLNDSITSYASNVYSDYVLALIDTSLIPLNKEGCLFLGNGVYLKGSFEKALHLEFDLIDRIEYFTTEKTSRFGKIEMVENVIVYLKNNKEIELNRYLTNINSLGFVKLIEGVLEEANNGGEYVSKSQVTPLSEMSEEVKINYIKIIANFAYSYEEQVDVEEYTEIMSLISRIELESESRLSIRAYLIDKDSIDQNDFLLEEIKKMIDDVEFKILTQSLAKDILYLFGIKEDLNHWSNNLFIQDIFEYLKIKEEEVDLLIAAIKNDEDILKYRKNDTQIEKSIKDLSSKAVAIGLPLTAIYFSGSVVGLSAAGITSGLAAMGMGGLLGFSSMFTGIGALVLLGLGTYQGLKKISGIGDLQNNKQREYMLQAIIRNSQKSLTYLIEDINAITFQLMEEMKKVNQNTEKINTLFNLLEKSSQGAKLSAEKQEVSQIEQVITHLPLTLDKDRLIELTNKPTLQNIQEFVLSCYIEDFVEDNQEKTEYRLREDLLLEEVEKLEKCLEEIEYNNVVQASFATASAKAKNIFRGKQ